MDGIIRGYGMRGNTAVIVQARMGSSRLPGKVLLDICGRPMLEWVLFRLAHSKTVDQVIVATSTLARDDILAKFCAEHGYQCHRGDQDDVLDRYYQAAKRIEAAVIVRVTSDCPFIDPEILDVVVESRRRTDADYASNTQEPRTFPRGLDVEVFTFGALEKAWREDKNPAWREHVTPYLYRTPSAFRLAAVTNNTNLSAYRWTVDTPEDLEFARQAYTGLSAEFFGWREMLDLLKQRPELADVNRHIEQKKVEGP